MNKFELKNLIGNEHEKTIGNTLNQIKAFLPDHCIEAVKTNCPDF